MAAVSVYRERAPPDASLKLMQDAATTSMEVSSSGDGSLPTVHGEFDVAVTWSKPVTNFSANALKIGGAGGSVLAAGVAVALQSCARRSHLRCLGVTPTTAGWRTR